MRIVARALADLERMLQQKEREASIKGVHHFNEYRTTSYVIVSCSCGYVARIAVRVNPRGRAVREVKRRHLRDAAVIP